MNDPANPLEYETPRSAAAEQPGLMRYISVPALVAGYVLVGAVLIVCMLIVPFFEAVFKDFNTQLPWLTRAVLEVSRWVRLDFGWVLLQLLPVMMAIGVGVVGHVMRPAPVEASTERRLLRWGWTYLLVGALLLVLAAVFIIAMFLPMVTLVETVGGP